MACASALWRMKALTLRWYRKNEMIYRLFLAHLLAICCAPVSLAQVYRAEGRVLDAVSREPMAFVHVVVNDDRSGTTTAIDGSFRIQSPEPIRTLTFSFVGYVARVVDWGEMAGTQPEGHVPEFLLQRSTFLLREVVVEAGENPAETIMRKVVDNRDRNNPEKITSFSYKSYNKFIVDADLDSADLRTDTSQNDIGRVLEKQYLFLMESLTERKYKFPGRSSETVLANRVSGLKSPMFTTLANSFQPFSFYRTYISILDKNYLNPVSPGSESKYFFWLEDSLESYGHKVYIISFEPRRRNFDGLKGLLYINTRDYAVEHVIAETANLFEHLNRVRDARRDERNNRVIELDHDAEPPQATVQKDRTEQGFQPVSIVVRIQQKYELLEADTWFPTQLNTDILIGDATQASASVFKGIGRSYLTEIRMEEEIRNREFGRMAVEYHPEANRRDSTYWELYRAEPIGPRGQETYRVLDSLGRSANLDRTVAAIGILATGKIPAGPVDIDLNRLVDFNFYEYLRLGMGLQTSNRLSRSFRLSGYGAWATGDKAFKYGGSLDLFLTKRNDLTASFLYKRDVEESGGLTFYLDNNFLGTERRRRNMIGNMDRIEAFEGALSLYLLKYLDLRAAFGRSVREVTTSYRYEAQNPSLEGPQNIFGFAEMKLGLRYAFREQYVEMFGNRVSRGTAFPRIWLNLTRGLDALGGDFDYTKTDFKITHSFLLRGFGQPAFTLAAGYARGDLPYPMLYNGNGSYENRLPLEASGSFQVMRMNEFLSDRYVSLYYEHKLGLIKLNPRRSVPEFVLIQNIGFGDLRYPERHLDYPFKTLEKGYYESGLAVRNIYKIRGIFGFGLAGIYRYGPYRFARAGDNIAIKIALGFSL